MVLGLAHYELHCRSVTFIAGSDRRYAVADLGYLEF